ncbi:MAG TPA: RNA 2',3'-cyclic phosphodiesterase [Burkholderiaceae bacterium]|nr:RNA 2',3'-cyclic phosphodiesterase [Burkholderiaceae bacterium]
MSPAPTTPDTLRLFVALWPDAGALAWLHACDTAIAWPADAARAGPERWHVTLHFLGAVPRAQLIELLPALQQPFAPFAFELGRVAAWPRGLVVVEPASAAPALHDLQAALGQVLQRCGRRIEARTFKPHVTLARRANRATLAAPPSPQRWPVPAYALVASAGGRYRNVALYPGGVLSPAPDPAPATTRTRPARPPTPR